MSNTIIKPDRDEDFYVLWSDNTDMPVCWGTTEDFVRWYQGHSDIRWMFGEDLKERFNRADERSNSSMIAKYSWDEDFPVMYGQYGYVLRSEMRYFLNVISDILVLDVWKYDDPRVLKLLHPLVEGIS